MTDETPPREPRFIDAMPRPLLVLFAILCVAALAVTAILMVRPTTATVALQDRRPAPAGDFTHDVGLIVPAPLPRAIPTLPAACPAVETTKIVAGGDGVLRIRAVLKEVCRLAAGGVPADVTAAIPGLRDATIRFGGFDRTGAESTTDLRARTIWLNIKFALRKTRIESIVPVVLHEAWHLTSARTPVTAGQELAARHVEDDTCGLVLPESAWPRWCHDARALARMPSSRAIALLVSSGYSS